MAGWGTHNVQMPTEALEPEVQAGGSCMWVLGTESGSSTRAANAPNHGAMSPAPKNSFIKLTIWPICLFYHFFNLTMPACSLFPFHGYNITNTGSLHFSVFICIPVCVHKTHVWGHCYWSWYHNVFLYHPSPYYVVTGNLCNVRLLCGYWESQSGIHNSKHWACWTISQPLYLFYRWHHTSSYTR